VNRSLFCSSGDLVGHSRAKRPHLIVRAQTSVIQNAVENVCSEFETSLRLGGDDTVFCEIPTLSAQNGQCALETSST
jgi:hypothetical protein